ncbi:hypothetical protein [Prochlorococcus sp. MIT 1303]|uniref:hypothetical protein n=1 Tax=Prochlorococcus sp. MIT 1303 TaxID=1723647 RepID=UPI0012E8206E|nr:hypothetical protein [Prochlorococcus sp. MIT 1303]
MKTYFSCSAAVVNSARDGDCGSRFTAMDKGDGFHQLSVLGEVGDPGAVSERHERGS